MKRLSVAASFAMLIWACGGESRFSSPTSPTAPPAPATYTLSGAVFEATSTGQKPVEGVRVEEVNVHAIATTDANGVYSISGLYAGTTSIVATKEGYEILRRDVSINGDTRLDIEVVRRATYTLSGVVSEVTPSGQAPVEGVHVEDSNVHAVATTDANGVYSISGLYAGGTSIWVNKEGYQSGSRPVTIAGDTRFDIQIVRR